MRRARRADKGQADIVAALRKVGFSVEVLSDVGRGVPDILCARDRVNYLIEVKSMGGTLTSDQAEWIGKWRGAVLIVDSPDGALRAVGAVR